LDQPGFSIAIFDYQKIVIKPMDSGYGVSENGELWPFHGDIHGVVNMNRIRFTNQIRFGCVRKWGMPVCLSNGELLRGKQWQSKIIHWNWGILFSERPTYP